MTRPPHWITGHGCLSAAGVGVLETIETLLGGDMRRASVLDPEETRFFKLSIQDDWLRRFDFRRNGFMPNLFALLAAEEAIASAGLTPTDLKKLRVGVCLGSTVGCTNYQEEFALAYNLGKYPTAEALFDFYINNSSQFISRYFECQGPVQMVNNACTSGSDTVGIAANWLDADLCDLVICGGTEVVLSKIYSGFRSLMLCSPVVCKPFDKTRQGLTLGDGAGILILEKTNSPRAPKAQFLGYGAGSDAFHPTSPHPEARGLQLAAQTALSQAGLLASDISFINAHGTGTPHNDLAEGRWVKQHAPDTRLVATKGYTGHTLGAAGGLEAIFTILSLIEQRLPPSRGFQELDPEIGFAPTSEVESGKYETALSFSLGFGGTNSVLCLGRAP